MKQSTELQETVLPGRMTVSGEGQMKARATHLPDDSLQRVSEPWHYLKSDYHILTLRWMVISDISYW